MKRRDDLSSCLEIGIDYHSSAWQGKVLEMTLNDEMHKNPQNRSYHTRRPERLERYEGVGLIYMAATLVKFLVCHCLL